MLSTRFFCALRLGLVGRRTTGTKAARAISSRTAWNAGLRPIMPCAPAAPSRSHPPGCRRRWWLAGLALLLLPFLLLALLGLFQLAIPCVLAVRCGRVLKAPEMALLGLLEVIFGILLAWGGAGERPGPAVLTGGLLVIGALVLNEFLGWKEQK